MKLNKNLFLCPPNYLEFEYIINPWMTEDTNFSLDNAVKEWSELYNLYISLYPDHTFRVEPKSGLTELCFLGDSIFSYKGHTVFSRLATSERYDETEYVIQVFRDLGFEGHRVPEGVYYEGSGETVVWNDIILVGYGQRSNDKIVNHLENELESRVIGLNLIDPKYYHLDTALFPVSNELIALYEPAFDKESIRVLENLDCELLKLDQQSALDFALNSIALNNNILVHYKAKSFISKLKKRGFDLYELDVSEFIKFGGGLKCLTFQQYI